MKDRLELLIKHFCDGNKRQFSLLTGVSTSIISNLTGGRENKPSYEVIIKILQTFSNVNPDWFILGNGDMFRNCEFTESLPTINQVYKGSPYYNVDFVGGFDLLMNDQTINPDFYINYPPYNKDGVVWVNLTGRSMEPELSNGDIIAMKPMNTPIQYLPTKEIYAIVTEEWRTVKRIELSDRDGFIRLLPSNPEYKAQEIPISMITRVYAVLGSIRKFF